MIKNLLPLFLLLIIFSGASAQIPISSAHTMPTGSTVTVRGIITNGNEFGTIRYFQDGTGGIAAYSSTMSNVQRGDSVEVTGVISPYNNLIELNPVNSFTVISTGNPMPAAIEVNMLTGYSESYESRLVRFNNSSFLSTGNFQASTSANYDATDGSLVSAEVRVLNTTNIAGTPIPTGSLALVGIMSQYQSSYQLLPRDLNDFVLSGNPPVLSSVLFQFNITPSSFDVSFNTLNSGNTIIYYGTTTALGSVASDATMTTTHQLSLTGLTAATLYYVKAASVSSTGDTSYSSMVPMMSQSLSPGTITCYFTRSVDNSVATDVQAKTLAQTVDDTLIAYLNRAKYSVDIAIYNMDNDNGIVDAINAAYNRGVAVRVIGDGENMDIGSFNQLQIGTNNKKLSPVGIDYGIMHNKFIAIDAFSVDAIDAVLWTGSLNFTDQQVNVDANNVIIFRDQSLAKAYEMEFGEMWSGVFGPDKANNTPKEFNVGGNRVELYFSPSDDTESEIRRTIETTDHDLEFCVYSYTRFSISYSIDDMTTFGVYGGGIVDDSTNGGYAMSILQQNMTNTLYIANHSYLVHNKYLLADANAPGLDPIVLTGSHNWTTSAQTKNDENTVVVHNAAIANQYYQEWVARYKDEGGTVLPGLLIGIDEASASLLQLSMFPNPASEWLQVKYDLPITGTAQLSVVDLTGKIVWQQEVNGSASSKIISVEGLQDGMYFVQLNSGTQRLTGKFMVVK